MARVPGVVGSVIEERSKGGRRIDRKRVCPHLLRVFINLSGRHNSLNDYFRGRFPDCELQFHVWMDATLMELTKLILSEYPEARRKDSYFNFALVYPDPRSNGYRMKDVGATCVGRKGPDDFKTLFACRYQMGDYLDISVQFPIHREEPSTSRRGR